MAESRRLNFNDDLPAARLGNGNFLDSKWIIEQNEQRLLSWHPTFPDEFRSVLPVNNLSRCRHGSATDPLCKPLRRSRRYGRTERRRKGQTSRCGTDPTPYHRRVQVRSMIDASRLPISDI